MPSSSAPTVLIYRSIYGQLSETFVRDHVHGLSRFRPLVLTNRIDPCSPAETAETVVVPADGRLSHRLWQWGRSRTTHRLLRDRAPALIHAHFLTDGVAILPYAKAHGIPLIVTAHGYDATTWPEVQAQSPEGRLLLARRGALAAYATRILCVSDFIRDELITRGYPADRLVTHPLGVDTAAIRPRGPGPRRGILTVGRLVEKKGTRFLIEAYAALPPAMRAEHPLTIIGDGPLRGRLEALATSLGVAPVFAGGCPRDRVMAKLAESALFCFPSIRAQSGDAEGMGIAIMEALALGVPTLIFDEQPAAPLFHDHGAGALARAGDAADLARAMADMLADPVAAAQMAARGRALCETVFDIVRNHAGLENIYSAVAAQ